MEKRTYFVMPPLPVRHARTIEMKLFYPDESDFSPWIAKVTFSTNDLPYYRFGTWTQSSDATSRDGAAVIAGTLRLSGVCEGDIVAMRIVVHEPDVTRWFVERDGMLRRLEKREDALREWYDLCGIGGIPTLGN